MAIRLREVDGQLVALCAARSVPQAGDVYLDDGQHYALMLKFARDFADNGIDGLPDDAANRALADVEESNNANRSWWDGVYGGTG